MSCHSQHGPVVHSLLSQQPKHCEESSTGRIQSNRRKQEAMLEWDVGRSFDHGGPDDCVAHSRFGYYCSGSHPTSEQAPIPDLKFFCLLNPDNNQLDHRRRNRCILDRKIVPPPTYRFPALYRRSRGYPRPPRASHVVDIALPRRYAPLLPIKILYGATCVTNNPKREKGRHHCPHYGDI